uniref:Uncharacterized protein n=1 Tax=Bursaphelenchus xylophilus TaxID=6326 RepID=A0A1I7SJC3_BURXY
MRTKKFFIDSLLEERQKQLAAANKAEFGYENCDGICSGGEESDDGKIRSSPSLDPSQPEFCSESTKNSETTTSGNCSPRSSEANPVSAGSNPFVLSALAQSMASSGNFMNIFAKLCQNGPVANNNHIVSG